jgi:hypothetical protein
VTNDTSRAGASTYTVRIDNTYTDGHRSSRTVELPAPDRDLDEWFDDVVYPETGNSDYAGERGIGTVFTATIIACDVHEHVGRDAEWVDHPGAGELHIVGRLDAEAGCGRCGRPFDEHCHRHFAACCPGHCTSSSTRTWVRPGEEVDLLGRPL